MTLLKAEVDFTTTPFLANTILTIIFKKIERNLQLIFFELEVQKVHILDQFGRVYVKKVKQLRSYV